MAYSVTRCAHKKLIAWVRWIYSAGEDPGVTYCKEACGDHALETPCGDCLRPRLLPENIEAVNVFHACDTQWRFAGNGIRMGLEYPAVSTVMALRETENKKDVFHSLKIMEAEVLTIELERREKKDAH